MLSLALASKIKTQKKKGSLIDMLQKRCDHPGPANGEKDLPGPNRHRSINLVWRAGTRK